MSISIVWPGTQTCKEMKMDDLASGDSRSKKSCSPGAGEGALPGQGYGQKAKIIHWAPLDGVKVKVMKLDGIDEGIGEAGIAEELGKVVQFERYGFVRINFLGEPIVANYAHR
jgi:hypothetical protein